MRVLRARLLAEQAAQAEAEANAARLSQVRTVDRSERIRTYNFPETVSLTTAPVTRPITCLMCLMVIWGR